MTKFEMELRDLINKHSLENASDTPDFILTRYITGCLVNFSNRVREREGWFGRIRSREDGEELAFKVGEPLNNPHRVAEAEESELLSALVQIFPDASHRAEAERRLADACQPFLVCINGTGTRARISAAAQVVLDEMRAEGKTDVQAVVSAEGRASRVNLTFRKV